MITTITPSMHDRMVDQSFRQLDYLMSRGWKVEIYPNEYGWICVHVWKDDESYEICAIDQKAAVLVLMFEERMRRIVIRECDGTLFHPDLFHGCGQTK